MSQHIIGLKVENFKRLHAIKCTPQPVGLQEVRGQNSQGKSSLLDAIQAALGGKALCPKDPIRQGSSEARIILETDELRIYRRFDEETGDFLSIEPREGGPPLKKPQQILDSLLGNSLAFDPLAFTRMKDGEQAELLRQVTGLDTRDLDAEREKVYTERTFYNREASALRAKLSDEPCPEEVPEPGPAIDMSELTTKFSEAARQRVENDKKRSLLADLVRQLEQSRREVYAAEQRVVELGATLEQLLIRKAKGEATVNSLVDPDTAELERQIKEAGRTNEDRQARLEARRTSLAQQDRRSELESTLKIAENNADGHTARLQEIDREKQKRVEGANMPVKGLSVEGGRVTLNGVPFSQASQSQKIRTGLAICAALNPGIRIQLVRDGSLLDQQARAELAAWAEENNYQIWLELVGDGPTGITIHDGRVASVVNDR